MGTTATSFHQIVSDMGSLLGHGDSDGRREKDEWLAFDVIVEPIQIFVPSIMNPK